MGEAHDIALGAIGTPTRWYVVFNRQASTPFRSFIAFGKFKHVRAFGYAVGFSCWVFYDVKLSGTDIVLARGEVATNLMAAWTHDASIVEMPVSSHNKMFLRFGFWCVPAVKHLIGLRSGAFRPDRLWLDCLKAGGNVIFDGHGTPASAADQTRPDVRPVAEPG